MAYLPLPRDTKVVFSNNSKQSDNAFLLFNRYLEGEGYNFDTFDTQKTKEELYRKIQNFDLSTAPFVQRSEASLARLQKAGYLTRTIKLKSVSRLIVGLGDKNALEVGFTFHPLYGYPYIPGSSLKGLCRSWLEIAENEFEGQSLAGEVLTQKIRSESRDVFGSVHKSDTESDSKLGDVLFFDAIPTEDTKLEFDVDIMNPHYSPYYSAPEKSPPGDWYSPLPIKFLTIKEGATFAFFLASESEDSLNKAAKWLLSGLSELGIGSKTSSGYGYFDPTDLKDLERQKEREAQKAEDERIEKLKREAEEKATKIKPVMKQLEERVDTGSKTQLGSLIYESWKALETDEDKIKGAKLIKDKFGKELKKKKKKTYAQELLEWANKYSNM